jgi:hypothetical protein
MEVLLTEATDDGHNRCVCVCVCVCVCARARVYLETPKPPSLFRGSVPVRSSLMFLLAAPFCEWVGVAWTLDSPINLTVPV